MVSVETQTNTDIKLLLIKDTYDMLYINRYKCPFCEKEYLNTSYKMFELFTHIVYNHINKVIFDDITYSIWQGHDISNRLECKCNIPECDFKTLSFINYIHHCYVNHNPFNFDPKWITKYYYISEMTDSFAEQCRCFWRDYVDETNGIKRNIKESDQLHYN